MWNLEREFFHFKDFNQSWEKPNFLTYCGCYPYVCTKPYLGGYSGIPNPISHENLYLEHGNFSLFRRTLLHLPNIGMETGFCKCASSAGYWTNLTKDLLSKQNFCYRFINHPGAFPCFSLCACCYKMKDLCVDFQAMRGNNSIGKQGTSYFFRKS